MHENGTFLEKLSIFKKLSISQIIPNFFYQLMYRRIQETTNQLSVAWSVSYWLHASSSRTQLWKLTGINQTCINYGLIQDSHGSLKPLKSMEFILAPWTLEIAWNFV